MSLRGRKGLIGALIEEAETLNGWYEYRPACRICSAILPPASCTARVMARCRRASMRLVSLAPKGSSQPVRLGAYPPVTISPTPPRVRSAKYSAKRGMCLARSSRPVCIDPITTRFGRVVNPRSNGDNRVG